MKRKIKGFTLVEMIVITILVSVLASIAIPRYREVVSRAKELTAVLNLTAILSAVEIYKEKNGDYPPDGVRWLSLADINAGLGLQLEDSAEAVYECYFMSEYDWSRWVCMAYPIGKGEWWLNVHADNEVHCSEFSICPTCESNHIPGACFR